MSFAELVGHEMPIRLLKNQLRLNHLPTVYLFVGPRGIGKRSLGIQLALHLECEDPQNAEACGGCRPCQKIREGSFPDLSIIAPESDGGPIKIDQIRALIHWVMLTPTEGKRRIALLTDAQQMNEEASNACLKLLEEPPEKSLLILTAQGLHRLPPTLVSRCHLIRCVGQGVETVARFLNQKQGIDPTLANWAAMASGGRLGLALQFLQTERWKIKNEWLDQWLAAFAKRQLELPMGNSPREEIQEGLDWLIAWWRDLLILKLGGELGFLIHSDRVSELKQAIPSVSVDSLIQRIERATQAREAVERNASGRMALASVLSHV